MSFHKVVKNSVVSFFVLAMLLTSVQAGFSQSQQIAVVINRIISTEFPTVDVSFSIYEKSGSPITGISSSDFSLKEDGAEISNFQFFDLIDNETPLSIALVIDTSGSMVDGEITPLQTVVEAAELFIGNLQSHDSIGLVSFNENVTVEQELTTDKDDVVYALNNLTSGSNASLYDAIFEGIDMVKNSEKKKAVIVVTDGNESLTSVRSLNDVYQASEAWNVPVYTIGFGDAIIKDGVISKECKLEEIAKNSGGLSQIQSSPFNMDWSMEVVGQLLRQIYHVVYTSSLAGDSSEHSFSIEFHYNGKDYSDETSFIPNPIDITIVDPQPNALLSLVTPITVEAVSPSRIAQVNFSLDGTEIQVLDSPSRDDTIYEINFDPRSYEPGDHELTVQVVDINGNIKEEALSISIREPIQVEFIAPVDGEQLVARPLIKVNIDSVLDLVSVTLALNNEVINTYTTTVIEEEWPVTAYENGVYTISVDVEDIEGNTLSKSIQVKIGTTLGDIENTDGSESNSGLLFFIIFGGGAVLLALLLIIISAASKKKNAGKQKAGAHGKASPGKHNQPPSNSQNKIIVLKEVAGLQPGKEWKFEKPEIRLGRNSEDNDIQLKGLNASRRMAMIRKGQNGYVILSLNPKNPVLINGKPVSAQQTVIKNGDQIQLGESVFQIIEVAA